MKNVRFAALIVSGLVGVWQFGCGQMSTMDAGTSKDAGTGGGSGGTGGTGGGTAGTGGTGGGTAGTGGTGGGTAGSGGTGGGTAGTGGTGGGTAGTGGTGGGTAGGTGGTGGGTGGTGGAAMLPACSAAFIAATGCSTYTDLTDAGTTTITWTNPLPINCVRIKRGQSVTVSGISSLHPFELDCGPVPPQAVRTSNINTALFPLGTYGFHCVNHGTDGGTGMAGMAEIVP